MVDLSEDMWNLARQQQQTPCLHYRNAYVVVEGGDLPWGAPTHKITWLFDYSVLLDHMAS